MNKQCASSDLLEYTVDIELLAKELKIETHQGKRCLQVALSNVQLINRKQRDYGPKNISISGELGCVVRCQDKISRLFHLLRNGAPPANESIGDSWRDLGNYALIATVLRDGNWEETR